MARVAVNIVTHNEDVHWINACLESVFRQEYRDFQVTVFDNQSVEEVRALLATWERRQVRVIANSSNIYYSRAHNRAIRETDSEFVLTLNPDVVIRPDYLTHVVEAFDRLPQIGSINGKLLLVRDTELVPALLERSPSPDMLIDGAGLRMRKSRRPDLRGSLSPHGTCCLEPAYIFGADGACAVYRRAMLEHVAIDGEVFDNDFMIYREDVDLAWRAQLFGWDSYYVPAAVAYHIRGFRPGQRRRTIRQDLKLHSVKNGWLIVVKNDLPGLFLRDCWRVLPYQLRIMAGLLTIEPSSLAAIPLVARLMPRMLRKRRQIQRRRKRSAHEMRRWFE